MGLRRHGDQHLEQWEKNMKKQPIMGQNACESWDKHQRVSYGAVIFGQKRIYKYSEVGRTCMEMLQIPPRSYEVFHQ